MGAVDANPERYVPWGDNPDSPYRPPEPWVRRFLQRHKLKYRSSMHINGARARVTREELELWFEDVREILSSDPELVEAALALSVVWALRPPTERDSAWSCSASAACWPENSARAAATSSRTP